MTHNKIAALNPTVRRALGKNTAATSDPPAVQVPGDPLAELCPRCHDVGLVRVNDDGQRTFSACPLCRTSALQLLVTQVAPDKWIAVRDMRGLWGTGPSAVHAFLDLERKTPDSVSSFAQRYLRHAASGSGGRASAAGSSGQVA